MKYLFTCENCGKSAEIDIKLADYDSEKDKQFCECGGKMKRIIEWQGGAYHLGGYSDVGGIAKWQ